MAPGETLQQVIARNVREYRHARGLTLDALAEAAGLSRRMLIMIEGGTTNPSVATLDRLGQALGVGFAGLVGLPPPTGEAQLITPDAMPAIWRGAGSDSVARLAVSLGSRGEIELWDWRMAAGEVFVAGVDPPGTRKLLFVLAGVLTVRLADSVLRVPAGHGARIPGDRPHGYENRDEGPLHFVGTVVLGTPARGEP
jgi:transcriptional regulator with XRE-family HTH domain